LTGIAKPPSPFRRVDVPTPQQQQQQQQQRKPSIGVPQHFRPQAPPEPPLVPPSNTNWLPPQNTTSDLTVRPGAGSLAG
jgi:hypothetical protein